MASKKLAIKITARETIKPSSSTPHHLRNFKLSLLDQILPLEYSEVVLLYTTNGDNIDYHVKAAQISQRLKTSLSQTLTRFYPFAGIIKDSSCVECNNNGAEFVEADANCRLSDILQQPDQMLGKFAPIDVESPQAGPGPLLLAQVTFFECGGLALTICFSHKMVDGWTGSKFVDSWAKTALESRDDALLPEFVGASLFPPDKSLPLNPFAEATIHFHYATRRFVFDASKTATLKTKVASAIVPKPTRGEAVIALIWKCTIAASRSIRAPRLSLTAHYINLRNLVSTPLSENCMGNFIGTFAAQTNEREINLQDLVSQLRKGKDEFSKNGLKTVLENKTILPKPELHSQIYGDEIDLYVYSNITRFPFYEADFGWGKPIWATMPGCAYNLIMQMATRDGEGIEALVSLREADMAVFERDPELLAFATFNPSVLPYA